MFDPDSANEKSIASAYQVGLLLDADSIQWFMQAWFYTAAFVGIVFFMLLQIVLVDVFHDAELGEPGSCVFAWAVWAAKSWGNWSG